MEDGEQARSYFGSSLAVYAWDDAMAEVEAARQVAAEKRVMGDEWDVPFIMIYAGRIERLPDYSDSNLLN